MVTITVRSVGTHPAAGDCCTPLMACRRTAKSALGWSETVAHYSVHSVMAGSRRKSLGSLETRWPVRKWLFHRAEALIYPCQGGKRIIKRKLAAVTVRSQNEKAVEVNDWSAQGRSQALTQVLISLISTVLQQLPMIYIFKESLSSYLGGGRGGEGVKKPRFSLFWHTCAEWLVFCVHGSCVHLGWLVDISAMVG